MSNSANITNIKMFWHQREHKEISRDLLVII